MTNDTLREIDDADLIATLLELPTDTGPNATPEQHILGDNTLTISLLELPDGRTFTRVDIGGEHTNPPPTFFETWVDTDLVVRDYIANQLLQAAAGRADELRLRPFESPNPRPFELICSAMTRTSTIHFELQLDTNLSRHTPR